MYPLILAGVAAAAFLLTNCSENDPPSEEPPTETANEENIRATLEQASRLVRSSPPGTKIAIPFHCTSFLTGSRDNRSNNRSFYDSTRNGCQTHVMSFQQAVIENFGEHGVECSAAYFSGRDATSSAMPLFHSAVCTVTKR